MPAAPFEHLPESLHTDRTPRKRPRGESPLQSTSRILPSVSRLSPAVLFWCPGVSLGLRNCLRRNVDVCLGNESPRKRDQTNRVLFSPMLNGKEVQSHRRSTARRCNHTDAQPARRCNHTDAQPARRCNHTDAQPARRCNRTDAQPDGPGELGERGAPRSQLGSYKAWTKRKGKTVWLSEAALPSESSSSIGQSKRRLRNQSIRLETSWEKIELSGRSSDCCPRNILAHSKHGSHRNRR